MKAVKLLLCFVFFIFVEAQTHSFCQDTIRSSIDISIRLNTYYTFEIKRDYNFRVIHTAPVFSFQRNSHNFYIGPQYSYVFQPTPIASEIYEKNSYGINVGYRYYSKELVRKLRAFGQFNFSIYKVKYIAYQLGPPFSTEKKKIIVENTASIGIDFNAIKNIHVYSGIGFGSFGGFFLLIDSFTLNSYIGLEYKF